MDPFVYLERYRVIVCQKCEFACVSDEVSTHLLSKHHDLPCTTRRAIAEAVAHLPNIRRNQADLFDFQFPPPNTNPIPHLSPPQTDGLKCRRCPYVVRHEKKMKQHCRDCHNWQNTQGRGRPRLDQKDATIGTSGLPPELPWRDNVHCQRFFLSRAASGWFEVKRKTAICKSKLARGDYTEALALPSKLPPETQTHIQGVVERHERYVDARNQPRHYAKALGEESLAATSPWLDRTQWRTIYRDARRDILRAMIRLPVQEHSTGEWKDMVLGQGAMEGDHDIISPRQDEQKLACILKAVDLMLDRCENTVRHSSRIVRCWLLTSKSCAYHPKAFYVMTEPSTRYRYRMAWKQFISFIIRGHLMTAVNRRLVKVNLFAELTSQLKALWEHRVWKCIDMSKGEWPKVADERYKLTHSDENWAGDSLESEFTENISTGHAGDSQNEMDTTEFEEPEEEFSDELEEGLDDDLEDNVETGSLGEMFSDDKSVDKSSNQEAAELEFLELLFKLSLTLSTQPYLDGHPGSTLLSYFTGIFGFSPDCRRFKLARQYCPALSGPIYCSRLIFLEYALPLHAYHHIGIGQRPRTRQVEHLRTVCDRYTVIGSPSPLAELISLRNLDMLLRRRNHDRTYYDGATMAKASYGEIFLH